MSNPNAARIIEAYGLYRQVNSFGIAAKALFVWDYVITLDREVRYVWGRKPTIATVLFMVNRYVNLSACIFQLFSQATFQHPRSCNVVVRFVEAQIIISALVFALFFSMRIYATWGRDWRPALPILLLALVPPAANLYIYCKSIPVLAPPPSSGCATASPIPADVYQTLVLLNRACTTAYDFLVVVFTFIKTLGSKKAARRLKDQTPLTILLLRDGTLHFMLMLILNVGQIIWASLSQSNNALSYFMTPVTSILVSRFLLSLRRLNDVEEREATSVFLNTSIFEARQFHSEIIGNLGESLYWGSSVSSTAAHSDAKRTISRDLSTLDTISAAPSGTDYELSRLHDEA